MITISINTSNAAFDPEEGGVLELVRILRDIADEFKSQNSYDYPGPHKVRDINGNLVGYVTYSPVKA